MGRTGHFFQQSPLVPLRREDLAAQFIGGIYVVRNYSRALVLMDRGSACCSLAGPAGRAAGADGPNRRQHGCEGEQGLSV
ncbi:hypothetical protein DQ353_17040 [Arthrobacter sp. AQ5-05]|nr:hypothetical protein DQ353_17040 [Arthrobacter sp. AQ5-05]